MSKTPTNHRTISDTVTDRADANTAPKKVINYDATSADGAVSRSSGHATQNGIPLTADNKTAEKVLPAVQMGSDGFPKSGWVRPFQIYRPIGPLPISKAGFWANMASHIVSVKLSPRVTVFEIESIRTFLASRVSK